MVSVRYQKTFTKGKLEGSSMENYILFVTMAKAVSWIGRMLNDASLDYKFNLISITRY
jgi:hypothetical protein